MALRLLRSRFRLIGYRQSLRFCNHESTLLIVHDQGLNPQPSDKTFGGNKQPSSTVLSTSTVYPIQSTRARHRSEVFDATDVERRERLRQILTKGHATETLKDLVNDVEASLRNVLGNSYSKGFKNVS